MKDTYQLLDSGKGQKWERFGEFILQRPCSQAIWNPQQSYPVDALFTREPANRWTFYKKLPSFWTVSLQGIQLKIAPTDFGHLGVFPEHASLWSWMKERIEKKTKVLNLFAYSGGATLFAASQGAEVCHVDASKGMVDWARENASLNRLEKAPIRWIVDDVIKFLKREIKRQNFYDGILLDPPTFGRGNQGEVFKIETDILILLDLCRQLLSSRPKFVIFTCHTPGMTPLVLSHLFHQVFGCSSETGEMILSSPGVLPIPSGTYLRSALC